MRALTLSGRAVYSPPSVIIRSSTSIRFRAPRAVCRVETIDSCRLTKRESLSISRTSATPRIAITRVPTSNSTSVKPRLFTES